MSAIDCSPDWCGKPERHGCRARDIAPRRHHNRGRAMQTDWLYTVPRDCPFPRHEYTPQSYIYMNCTAQKTEARGSQPWWSCGKGTPLGINTTIGLCSVDARFGSRTGHILSWGILWFSSRISLNCWENTSIKQRPFSFKIFFILLFISHSIIQR